MFSIRARVRLLSLFVLVFAQVVVSTPANAAPGDLDPTFGVGGLVTTDFGASASSGTIRAMVQQPDGRVIAAGPANGSTNDLALVRYNPDGTLDPSFGSGGKVLTETGGSFFSQARAVSLQSDGKVVVAGYTFVGSNPNFFLARYSSDGSIDTAFGTGGFVKSFAGTAEAVVVQPDGKILVAGTTAPEPTDFALSRYNPDGSDDTSFGVGGKVTTDFFGIDDFGAAIALQPGGKIVVAGSAGHPGRSDFAMARYNPDGTLDATFGLGGKVTTGFGTSGSEAHAMTLQSDGRIVLAGDAGISNAPDTFDFALARYMPDGGVDASFGNGGMVTNAFSGVRIWQLLWPSNLTG